MAAAGKLTALKVASIKKPGRHRDGGNLALVVGKTGRKTWAFLYTHHGREREMGLGSVELLSLAEARDEALANRKLLRSGIDPIEARRKAREARPGITFEEVATEYIATFEPSWKNSKHAAQWPSTLKQYAYPLIGSVPVESLDNADVISVLKPIWHRAPETASRLRSRIERIVEYAKGNGWRAIERNPATWEGNLQNTLPSPRKLARVEHHAALAYRDVPAFIEELRKRPAVAARALEFLILTASRTNEVIGARWSEVDWEEKVWRLAAIRMKGAVEHVVPLADRALAILESNKTGDKDGFIFAIDGRPLSNMALLALIRRMKAGVTAHGFRSSFRDWSAEQTMHQHEVAEAALAHKIKSKIEAAYRRGTMLEKRRELMKDWATFCERGKKREAARAARSLVARFAAPPGSRGPATGGRRLARDPRRESGDDLSEPRARREPTGRCATPGSDGRR